MRSFAVNGVVDKSVSLEKLQHGLKRVRALAHEAVPGVFVHMQLRIRNRCGQRPAVLDGGDDVVHVYFSFS